MPELWEPYAIWATRFIEKYFTAWALEYFTRLRSSD